MSMIENAKNTVKEMLDSRGYGIENKTEEDIVIGEKKDDKLIVFFATKTKFNIEQLKYYIAEMNEYNLKHCIIVYPDQITSGAKKGIEDVEHIDVEIELFSLKELQYNLTKHRLVPQHILLNKEEGNEIRRKYGHDVPVILKSDPVCRYYNYKKGDIIKG